MREKLIFGFLSLTFIASRLYGTNRLPLFSDEAYTIIRAEELRHGAPILGMVRNTTQPFFIWAVSLLQLLPLPIIIASRLTSALFGLGVALLISKISSQLIHPSSALIAFLFTLFLPFSQFYDRTVLLESTVLFWIVAALFVPGVALPFALLTKATGFLALPLAFGVWWREKKVLMRALLLACVMPFVVWVVALGGFGQIEHVFQKTGVPLSLSVPIKANILRAKLWLVSYVTTPILLLSFLGVVSAIFLPVIREKKHVLLVIFLWTAGIFSFEVATAGIFYPRYLYPIILGVILAATSGSWFVIQQIKKFSPEPFAFIVIVSLTLFVFYPSSNFMYRLMTAPEKAPLPREDRFQFFEDWTSGVGSNELAKILVSRFPNGAHVYLEEENSYRVTIGQHARFSLEIAPWLWDPLGDIPTSVMAESGETLFIRNRHPDVPKDWPVELIAEIPKTDTRSVYLYRILK